MDNLVLDWKAHVLKTPSALGTAGWSPTPYDEELRPLDNSEQEAEASHRQPHEEPPWKPAPGPQSSLEETAASLKTLSQNPR